MSATLGWATVDVVSELVTLEARGVDAASHLAALAEVV